MEHPFLAEAMRRSSVQIANIYTTDTHSVQKSKALGHHVLRSLIAGWLSCGWQVRVRNKSALGLATRIYDRVIRDPWKVIPDLKSSCHKARVYSLNGREQKANIQGKLYPRSFTPSRTQLYQLSCISRTLPRPPERVVEAAIDEFKQTVLVPKPRLTEFGKLGQDLFFKDLLVQNRARKFKLKYSKVKGKPEHFSMLGASATCIASRGDGGRTGHFARSSRWAPLPAWIKNSSFPNDTRFILFGKTRTRAYFKNKTILPNSRIQVVRELGYKARIVTCNDPYRVAEAHCIRRILYPLVTKVKTTVLAEMPAKIWVGKAQPGYRVYSFDLKAATDNIRHDFLDRLADLLGVDPDLLHRSFKIDGQDVVTGAFMGMPVTWTLLEMVHQFVLQYIDPKRRYRTKGDDAIAYWPLSFWKKYKALMGYFGFVLNMKKTFIVMDRGTFCERLYIHIGNYLELQPTFSYKGLIAGQADIVTSLSQFSHESWKRGCDTKVAMRLIETFRGKFLKVADKMHVPRYLPISCGGLGLVPPDPSRKLSREESRIYRGLLDKELPTYHPTLTPVGPATRLMLKGIKKIKYRTGVQGECPELEDAVRRALAWTSCADSVLPRRERNKFKKPSYTYTLESLRKIFTKAPKHVKPHELDWKDTLTYLSKPTYTSIQSVYPHPCKWTAENHQ